MRTRLVLRIVRQALISARKVSAFDLAPAAAELGPTGPCPHLPR